MLILTQAPSPPSSYDPGMSMSPEGLSLAGEFPPAALAQWRGLVLEVLRKPAA